MSDATIRASIKTLLLAVTGIGKVHDYLRWIADEAELKTEFRTAVNQPLHGWEITRDGIPQLTRMSGDKYKMTHGYLIIGHYAMKDSVQSEKLFNLVVDAVVQKFIDNRLANTEGHSLPVVTIKAWNFAGVDCHRAEIRLSVTEIVTKTAAADEALLKVKIGQYLEPGTAVMWIKNTVFLLNAKVVPPVANGHKYKCTVAGTSHASAEPVWPVGAGASVVDGTATWTEDGVVVVEQAEINI